MKTIEIKEDGKVIKTAYLQKHGGTFAPDSLKLGGENFWMMDEPPFLYKDHNGNEVMKGQQIFWVQIKEQFDIDELWTVKDTISGNTYNPDYYAIFTTKEAADKFVSENRPKPLLTTHDGVEMTKGDTVYCYGKDSLHFEGVIILQHKFTATGFILFSTEAAAKKYIRVNKPVHISLAMIHETMAMKFEWENPIVPEIYKALEELVNEQFKQQ